MEVMVWIVSGALVAMVLAIAALAPKGERPVRRPVPVRIDDGKPRR